MHILILTDAEAERFANSDDPWEPDYAELVERILAGRITGGAEAIAVERVRQVAEEGWSPEHDDEHDDGSIAGAGASYAALAARQIGSGMHHAEAVAPPSQVWRWSADWWKPSDDPMRNLVRGGALIAAEIDRLLREEAGRDPNLYDITLDADVPLDMIRLEARRL